MSTGYMEPLFDLALTEVVRPVKPEPAVDWAALEGLAFLYTASEKGNNSGIRFMLTLPEAQAWCSNDSSCGTLHGTRWAYFYTTVANFITCHWGSKEPRVVTKGLTDNGQWDERIAALGLHKIAIADFPAVLTPLGVEVVE